MRLFALVSVALVSCTAFADAYRRQPWIDVVNYKFELTLSDETNRIEGTATIDVRFIRAGVDLFKLDLKYSDGEKGMTVTAVTGPNGKLQYSFRYDVLQIITEDTAKVGETVQYVVEYGGVPTGGLWIGENKHGDRGFFSLNWPNRAREWLPMVDHPYDKATHEFVVTAPSHYQVVSGGLLQSSVDNLDGTRTTHWKQSVPIASWLTALAVSPYAVTNFDDYEGIQLSTWVFPQDRANGVATFEVPALRAIKFFSENIGSFSYEKLANIQAAGFGGGTELASAIFYGQNSVTDQAATGLVAHEIAHQWWGNAVTEKDWNDVWLSEGFATYFTLLYTEHYEGREAFVEGLKRARDRVYSMESDNPDRPIQHADLQDMRQVTSGIQYQKGAWFLHMLRVKMGTKKFWQGIREYYAKYRDKNASTDDFRRAMEDVSGEDLERFFDQGLTRGVSAKIDVKWRYDDRSGNIFFEIEQIHDGPTYSLEFVVRLFNASGEFKDFTITIAGPKSAQLNFPATGFGARVEIDPNTQTLLRWTIEERR